MRLLIFNHLFDQDIDSLLHAGKEHELRILPLGPVVYLAQIYFPPKVFGGLTEFHDLKYVQNREKWVKEIESIMEKIFENFQFDAFILPSDTYFYIRPAIQWAQKNGIPCINVQKETSISPWTMESYSKGIKLFFPFICDIMTVCSHRHKEFWINAGADPNKIIILVNQDLTFIKNLIFGIL